MELKKVEKGAVSMFSDEDFFMMGRFIEENNPSLLDDPDRVKAEMEGLIQEIEKNLSEREEGYKEAISILLQGLNLLARLCGEQEYEVVGLGEDIPEEKEAPDYILSKKVAIYATSEIVGKSAKKTFGNIPNPEAVNYEFYFKVSPLLDDILDGKICGIISVHQGREGEFNVEGLIRHDLKNRSDWTYQKSQDYTLPPCENFGIPHNLQEIISIMYKMQRGEMMPEDERAENFYLAEALPHLKGHMLTPNKKIRVAVVDDTAQELENMVTVLNAWPNLECQPILQKDESFKNPKDSDIILLDEGLTGNIKGEKVQKTLIEEGFKGIIASSSGGGKPAWATHHFQAKARVDKNYATALEFVKFINSLLEKI